MILAGTLTPLKLPRLLQNLIVHGIVNQMVVVATSGMAPTNLEADLVVLHISPKDIYFIQ